MRFDLDGLDVFFPYDRLYAEQYKYMLSLKQALDAGGHALLEMPTGTGKTVCLLSLITSYQFSKPDKIGKLVYATRTVPEMNHVMEELATVLDYRAGVLAQEEENEGEATAADASADQNAADRGGDQDMEDIAGTGGTGDNGPQQQQQNRDNGDDSNGGSRKKPRRVYDARHKSKKKKMGPCRDGKGAGGSNVLALCLSSRRNMCVHDRVQQESDREAVDAACRAMTASWVLEKAASSPGSVETCPYYDRYRDSGDALQIPSGVYDLDSLQEYGRQKGWCPYFLTRHALNHANILVFNYQYMLDPKVAKLVSKDLEAGTVVVFDEAHNIDSVCIEALSVTVNDRGLEQATRSLGRLSSEVSRMKQVDAQRLQNEYQNLVNGLIDQGLLQQMPPNDAGLTSVTYIFALFVVCCGYCFVQMLQRGLTHNYFIYFSYARRTCSTLTY